jgi:uncharacterized protein (TIGR02118 family)
MPGSKTSTLLVTYVGDTSARFDRDYYSSRHLPLVSSAWDGYGLLHCEAYFWDAGEATDVPLAICLCHFARRDDIDTALAADESLQVMDDIANFTDLEPTRSVMKPVVPTQSARHP